MPIQHPVVDRLVEVHGADGFAPVEVGDGASHAENLIVGAGRKAKLPGACYNPVVALLWEPAFASALFNSTAYT